MIDFLRPGSRRPTTTKPGQRYEVGHQRRKWRKSGARAGGNATRAPAYSQRPCIRTLGKAGASLPVANSAGRRSCVDGAALAQGGDAIAGAGGLLTVTELRSITGAVRWSASVGTAEQAAHTIGCSTGATATGQAVPRVVPAAGRVAAYSVDTVASRAVGVRGAALALRSLLDGPDTTTSRAAWIPELIDPTDFRRLTDAGIARTHRRAGSGWQRDKQAIAQAALLELRFEAGHIATDQHFREAIQRMRPR